MKVWHYHNVMLNCNSTIVFFKQTMTYLTPDTQKLGAKITKPHIVTRRETAACLIN